MKRSNSTKKSKGEMGYEAGKPKDFARELKILT